jgi:hypothetical protein
MILALPRYNTCKTLKSSMAQNDLTFGTNHPIPVHLYAVLLHSILVINYSIKLQTG